MSNDENEQKPTKDAHRIAAIARLLEGGTITEIAKELGLSRSHLSTVLNDEVSKKMLRQSEAEIKSLIGTAVITLKEAMDARKVDMSNGLKAAMAVLKNSGLLKETSTVDVNLKPFVIERLSGDQVVLGAKGEDDE